MTDGKQALNQRIFSQMVLRMLNQFSWGHYQIPKVASKVQSIAKLLHGF